MEEAGIKKEKKQRLKKYQKNYGATKNSKKKSQFNS